MSDEDNNYDDFMVSDDDDLGVEMEDSSDEDLVPSPDQQPSKRRSSPSPEPQPPQINLASILLQQHRWNDAYSLLQQALVAVIDTDPIRCFTLRLSMVICSYHLQLLQETDAHLQHLEILAAAQDVLTLDHSVTHLINQIAPPLHSSLLFDEHPPTKEHFLTTSTILSRCSSLADRNNARLLQSRLLQYRIASINKDHGPDHARLLHELTQDPHQSLEDLEFLLACHVQDFLAHAHDLDVPSLQLLVSRASALLKNSLARSLRLLALLNFARAMIALHHYNSPHDHLKRISSCQTAFWDCYKCLEELGISSTLRDLTLCGFILSSMLLLGHVDRANHPISPFELEQLKVVETTPLLQNLKQIYTDFIDYNLDQFADSLHKIHRFHPHLSTLLEALTLLLQTLKLWNRVATLYSCISLQDIQTKLQIGPLPPLTRNDLLTILMKSIMNNTAKVYFKLDLTQDLVYFGDENRKLLTPFSKHLYLGTRNISPSASHSLKEWVDNVGVFETTPCRLKDMSSVQFLHELQQSRVASTVPESNSQTKSFKYSQLLTSVNEALDERENSRPEHL